MGGNPRAFALVLPIPASWL